MPALRSAKLRESLLLSFQAHVDVAATGDAIELAAGRWTGGVTFTRDAVVRGQGRDCTFLAAPPGGGPVIIVRPGVTVVIEGCTLVGGRKMPGAVLVPRGCVGGRGGVVRLEDAKGTEQGARLRLVDASVHAGAAVFGGGVYAGRAAWLHMSRTRVTGHWAEKGGGGLAVVGAEEVCLAHVAFADNRAGDGGHHLYAMAERWVPEIQLDQVDFAPCAGRGTGVANVRGFEARFALHQTAWPADSLKVPQRGRRRR